MKISFTTVPENLRVEVGYGYAGLNMIQSLQRQGHTVPWQDRTAPVEIAFCQPHWDVWSSSDQYHIRYTPWESSKLPAGWKEDFNQSDEVWTPSPLIAQWYKEGGVTVPIHVYQHGIAREWIPERRRRSGSIKFLHHGEPAPRKGGQMAFEAFLDTFGRNSKEASLTIKTHGPSTIREYYDGSIVALPSDYANMSIIDRVITLSELIALYARHDALVYPGWGEGFGFIPLQALASGMMTICTGAWAPYSDYLIPELTLSSKIVESPWPEIHDGKMFEPSYYDLVTAYERIANDFNSLADQAYENSLLVSQAYDWDRLTADAFNHIVTKFS